MGAKRGEGKPSPRFVFGGFPNTFANLIDKERELSYPQDRCSVNAKVYAYKEVLFTGRFGSRPFYSVQLYRVRLLQNRPHDCRSARQFHEWDGWDAWRDGTEGAL